MRHLIEAHGGTVHAESEGEGRGSKFTVTLPVQAVYAEGHNTERPRAIATPSEPVLGSLDGVTILVVDDEMDARELVALVLRANGANVSTAANAEAAVQLVTDNDYDVLISDIGMPDVNGYELIRRVRSLAGPKGCLPALALTAYAREQDRNRALEAGFQAHVAKPVEPTHLLRVTRELVLQAHATS